MIIIWAGWALVALLILSGCGMGVLRYVSWGNKRFAGIERKFGIRSIAAVWICAVPLAVSLPGLYFHSTLWTVGLLFGPFIWGFGFIIPILYAQSLLPHLFAKR